MPKSETVGLQGGQRDSLRLTKLDKIDLCEACWRAGDSAAIEAITDNAVVPRRPSAGMLARPVIQRLSS